PHAAGRADAARADPDVALVANGPDRLEGAERQVQQDALQLASVDLDQRQVVRDFYIHRDPAGSQAVGLEGEDALDEWPDRGRVALRRPLPREVEKVGDDAPCP